MHAVVCECHICWEGPVLLLPTVPLLFETGNQRVLVLPFCPPLEQNRTGPKLQKQRQRVQLICTVLIHNTTQLSRVTHNLCPPCCAHLPSCYWETQADVIMRQRNKENDVISRLVPGEAILLLDQHATLHSSSASCAWFFFLCGTFCSAILEQQWSCEVPNNARGSFFYWTNSS